MLKSNQDNKNLVNYWIESSDKDYKTMMDLFQTDNYQLIHLTQSAGLI